MAPTRALTASEKISPDTDEATEEVMAWQAEKIRAGLKDADEGRFATPEAVEAVIQKYTRNA